jgi:hypothetical protein
MAQAHGHHAAWRPLPPGARLLKHRSAVCMRPVAGGKLPVCQEHAHLWEHQAEQGHHHRPRHATARHAAARHATPAPVLLLMTRTLAAPPAPRTDSGELAPPLRLELKPRSPSSRLTCAARRQSKARVRQAGSSLGLAASRLRRPRAAGPPPSLGATHQRRMAVGDERRVGGVLGRPVVGGVREGPVKQHLNLVVVAGGAPAGAGGSGARRVQEASRGG